MESLDLKGMGLSWQAISADGAMAMKEIPFNQEYTVTNHQRISCRRVIGVIHNNQKVWFAESAKYVPQQSQK